MELETSFQRCSEKAENGPTVFKNKIKLDSNYTVFERVRKSKDGGGGVALGCDKQLHPVWVREGEEDVEALSVEISVKDMKIRCCVSYGFQENEIIEKKILF